MAKLDRLARIFKALSDPNRLAILELVRKRCAGGCRLSSDDEGNSVSAIAEEFDLALSTVSHHLKELRTAGLIQCEKRGQWVYCAPNEEVLKEIEGFIES
jgi:ArsR family transcriptional regulator